MREKNNRNDVIEIDLLKLISVYLRHWWLIVLCGVVLAAGAWLFSTRFITPMYRASVTIYVNNSSGTERVDYISSGNLSVAQQLVSTYVNIIQSDTVLEKVISAANLNCTAEELWRIMSTQQLSKTEMFKVYISHPEPERAAYIANAVAEVAPGAIEEIVEGSSTKIIDYAKTPQKPYTPNVKKNTLVGGAIGVLLALIYLTIFYLLDVRIKNEEDLSAIADYPVLGMIPEFSQVGAHNGRYGYSYGYGGKYSGKAAAKKPEGGEE
ncbi:MAG: hypothetical protein K6G66_08125 [Oscillospiraceae bacterium]|nr:hypothetical protein [Oscillospiraceae bacterium]